MPSLTTPHARGKAATKQSGVTATTSSSRLTITVRAPMPRSSPVSDGVLSGRSLASPQMSITSSLGSPTKVASPSYRSSAIPSPISPVIAARSPTTAALPSHSFSPSTGASVARRASITYRSSQPQAPASHSPAHGTDTTRRPSVSSAVIVKNGVATASGAGSRRSSFASPNSPTLAPAGVSGQLGHLSTSGLGRSAHSSLASGAERLSSTSSSRRNSATTPQSHLTSTPAASSASTGEPTTLSPHVIPSKPIVTSTTIHSPRHSLTPIEAAKAATAALRAKDRGPVSSPASLPLVMTLPEPTHLPIQRSPKIGRIGFDPRALLGRITSRPGSTASIASVSAPTTPTAPSTLGNELVGAAVKVQAARGLLFAANDPRLEAASGAAPGSGRIRSIVTASSGPTPLSQLLGLSKQTRPVVMFTLDELKVPPPFQDVSPYRGLIASALVGLINVGNTCYMAAALQCLVSIDLLTNFMLNDTSLANVNPFSDSKGAMAKAYTSLVRDMSTSRGAVNPRTFKRELEKWAPQFEGYDQQDAQEFLRYLLDALSSDLCRVRYDAKFVIKEADEDALPPVEKSQVAWSKYSHLQASHVADVFAGQLMSSVRCWVCGGVFHGFDVFWDLSVSIPSTLAGGSSGMRSGSMAGGLAAGGPGSGQVPVGAPTRVDLNACLREFAKEEELEPNEWYNCPTCKKRQRTSKRLQVHRLPPVLVIHLKRFASLRYKLTVPVDFPLDNLDVSSATTAHSPQRYRLVAVLEHSGSLSFGHYVASVLRGHEWYRMDDGMVDRILDPVRAKEDEWARSAYVLFYQAEPVQHSEDRSEGTRQNGPGDAGAELGIRPR